MISISIDEAFLLCTLKCGESVCKTAACIHASWLPHSWLFMGQVVISAGFSTGRDSLYLFLIIPYWCYVMIMFYHVHSFSSNSPLPRPHCLPVPPPFNGVSHFQLFFFFLSSFSYHFLPFSFSLSGRGPWAPSTAGWTSGARCCSARADHPWGAAAGAGGGGGPRAAQLRPRTPPADGPCPGGPAHLTAPHSHLPLAPTPAQQVRPCTYPNHHQRVPERVVLSEKPDELLREWQVKLEVRNRCWLWIMSLLRCFTFGIDRRRAR